MLPQDRCGKDPCNIPWGGELARSWPRVGQLLGNSVCKVLPWRFRTVFLLPRDRTKSGWLEVDQELDMGCQLLTRTSQCWNCRGPPCSSHRVSSSVGEGSAPDPLFQAWKAPFLTLRVTTLSGAPCHAPLEVVLWQQPTKTLRGQEPCSDTPLHPGSYPDTVLLLQEWWVCPFSFQTLLWGRKSSPTSNLQGRISRRRPCGYPGGRPVQKNLFANTSGSFFIPSPIARTSATSVILPEGSSLSRRAERAVWEEWCMHAVGF